MKRSMCVAATAILLLAACKKDPVILPVPGPPHPVMKYKDLQNATVKYQQGVSVDIDDDGVKDFTFSVLLVGDPASERDRLQFYAISKIDRNLLNNASDESPVLNKFDSITKLFPGYTWYQLSAIVVAEKITTMNGSYWTGLWKNASHKYLPVQVSKNGNIYHGWIELSFDTINENLVLHRAGLSTEADKGIMAGY